MKQANCKNCKLVLSQEVLRGESQVVFLRVQSAKGHGLWTSATVCHCEYLDVFMPAYIYIYTCVCVLCCLNLFIKIIYMHMCACVCLCADMRVCRWVRVSLCVCVRVLKA
jgi:hypothetical protein